MDSKSLSFTPGYTLSFAGESDWEEAMDLAWETFLRFEAAEYGREGTRNFLNFISGDLIYKLFLNGEYLVAVAKENGRIIGVGTVRNGHHISLLFVDEKHHRQGIGTAILSFLQQEVMKKGSCLMTVNAAPYGVPFYQKNGFRATADTQTTDGITYVPMMCCSEIIP
ncbi:MAG: GNAT family N-acetyltransferase [Lachnospiraceae bacterium]|nr:GNAT family N-acetyltransferase [Lachnospiraceae bacterium]